MNKKLKTLLSLGVVSAFTASAMLPVNALCKNNNHKCTTLTTSKLYIIINGVKYTLPLSPSCPIVPSIPTINGTHCGTHTGSPIKPSTTPDNSTNNNGNSNTTTKPNNNNSNSNATTKPNNNNSNSNATTKPNNNNNSNSNATTKPNNNNNNSNSNATTKPSTSTQNFSEYQKQVLDLVNAERTKRGLNPLTLDAKLSNTATLKSQDMINKGYFDHTSPTYGSPFDMMQQFGISYRSAGENIAMGQRTPQEVMNSWMNSSGHRANILNSSFTTLGVGIAKDANGTIYWTQMFIGK